MTTATTTKKTVKEKTLEQEVLEKSSKMSTREINEKINELMDMVNEFEGDDEEDLAIIKKEASLYAERWIRRPKFETRNT